MKKISPFQLIALLLLCRLFITMTYSPADAEKPLLTIAGGLIALLIQAAIIAAPIAVSGRQGNENVITAGFGAAKPVGLFLALLYGAFLIWTAARTLGDFSAFITFAFPVFTAKKTIVFFLAATALYICTLGPEPIARTAVIALALFAVMLTAVLLGTSGNIDIHNLSASSHDPWGDTLRSGIFSIGRDSELVLLCIMLPALRKSRGKTLYSFIGIKYLLVAACVFLFSAILGEFAQSVQLPFFHLSSYSDTAVIARFDALFLIVWTFCAVIKSAVYFWAAGACLGYIIPKSRPVYTQSAAAALALTAAAFSATAGPQSPQRSLAASAAVAILGGIIPVVVMLICPKKQKEAAK